MQQLDTMLMRLSEIIKKSSLDLLALWLEGRKEKSLLSGCRARKGSDRWWLVQTSARALDLIKLGGAAMR